MKRLLKFVLFAGAVAGAAWALRDQLMPPPQTPSGSPPAFRGPEAADSRSEGAADDLQRVNGIGPVRVRQLAEHGITTFGELAQADADTLAEQLGVSVGQTTDWISQATDLA